MNLNLRRLNPAEKVGEVEVSALGMFNMHFLTSCVPALYPVLREIKLKVKNTVRALEGFPGFPGGQEHKLVSKSQVLQRWLCFHSFQGNVELSGA